MLDVLVTLCLLDAPETCADRVVPVGRADCEAAMQVAAPRLEAWRAAHAVSGISCERWQAEPLDVAEIAPGVFVHEGEIAEPAPGNRGDVANLAIVVGETAVAVIDSGGSREIGERAVATVRALTHLPIAAVVLTHMHPDHVFGATALQDAGAEVIGHAELPLALASRADSYEASYRREIGPAFTGTATPEPDRVVEAHETLDLGGRVLRLTPWPTAHTETDLTVLDEATGTLIAGDLVFDRHAPALDGSLRGWLAALDRIGEAPPPRVVPGHGTASLPWPEGAAPLRRYLDTLARDTRQAIDEGLTLREAAGTVAASEAARWQLFDIHNPRNATVAYTELEWE